MPDVQLEFDRNGKVYTVSQEEVLRFGVIVLPDMTALRIVNRGESLEFLKMTHIYESDPETMINAEWLAQMIPGALAKEVKSTSEKEIVQ